jgi:general stress protein 26
MDIAEVLRFLEGEKFAVLATASEDGKPEAALMGFAVTPQLEIIFDTVRRFRKYPNLKKNPRVAWVIGYSSEISVQYEGIAVELEGAELEKYKTIYAKKYPDSTGRDKWPDLTYFLVRPKWVRYGDYTPDKRRIEEQTF